MSKSHQSNYDKYGYTKTTIESNGKSIGAAECWVCKIPLHNTGITSLKRHRNKCKLESGEITTTKLNTEIEKCFICNETSNHCIPITTESKHTATRFSVFVRQFLSDNKSEPNVHDDLDGQMMCDKCIDKINEYDLACLTAERVAKEMCEILRNNQNALCKKRDDDNHSENVLVFEMKTEIEKIEVDCSLDDESLDGNDFIDFDHARIDESDNEENAELKSTQGKNSNVSPEMEPDRMGNDSNTSETKSKENEVDEILVITSAKIHSIAAKIRQNDSVSTKRNENQSSVDQKQLNVDDERLQCVICEKNFSLKKNLAQHMKLHTSQSDHQCDLCGKRFKRKSALTEHTNVHLRQNKMTCDICGKEFIYKWSLKVHMQIHANFKEYLCDCGKTFNRRDKMLEHRKNHGKTAERVTKKDPYECSECSATFRILKEFKKHRTQHKRDQYPYRCIVCNFDAKNESLLNKHVEMHKGLAPLQCVICKKLLAHKRNMIPHMRLHTGEKVYQCERCGKEFFHMSSFSAHMRYVHDGVRTLKCDICPRLFIDKSDLKKHMIIHSGTKPFSCEICLKTFTHKHNMMEHSKIHDKDPSTRAHKCSFCESSFNRKSNLTKHLERHGAIVPHTEIRNKLQFAQNFK